MPPMGESITEATVMDWRFAVGAVVKSGDILVELETDKVTLEVPAPSSGVLKEIKQDSGANVKIGDLLALLEEKAVEQTKTQRSAADSEAPLPPPSQEEGAAASSLQNKTLAQGAARLALEKGIDISQIQGSGKRGQVTKSDIVHYLDKQEAPQKTQAPQLSFSQDEGRENREELVAMSRLRQRIAERLLHSQHETATLTTFNEIDMHNAIALRKRYKEEFKEKYGVNLGFMSLFIKAVIATLKEIPSVHAQIREHHIVYKNYYDISVAVGGPKGLVVPVIRNADQLSFAEIEKEIARLAQKVKESTIELHELEGGSFTISNGGIYGSMLSTPILNPPQSAILGMHNIVKRPVVLANTEEIVVRPIMYVALSYDHRIIDGKEAVSFLVKVKEKIEHPERILLSL